MAANHFTASGIVTSYHVPIAFPALVYGGPSSTPNTPTGPHGSAKAVRPGVFICPAVLHEARPRRGIDGSPALYPWPLWVSERHPCPGQRADSRCPRRAGDAHIFLDQKHPSVRRRGLFFDERRDGHVKPTVCQWGTAARQPGQAARHGRRVRHLPRAVRADPL